MRRLILVLFALSCLMATPALAQSEPEPDPEAEEGPEIRYKERTEIDFQERRVDGEITSPRITLVGGLPDRMFKPLVQLKSDFDREMIESADSVR
jgi:hypothetical protein